MSTEGEEAAEEIPLQHAWTFWLALPCSNNATAAEYEASQKTLSTFSSVQGFWRSYSELPSLEAHPAKSSLHMMQRGVKPLWEDPFNESGGIWTFRVPKDQSMNVWKELLLAAIGEQFSEITDKTEGDDISGVTVSTRFYDDLVTVWNKRSDGDTEGIKKRLQSLLPGTELRNIFYKPTHAHNNFGKGLKEKGSSSGSR
eukprot:TRINITY_DN1405_c0_g1_i1.p1 TRINITY_DN1405_c0_g1~~TRINITY_DN1405_c0_g1_i1.p1  ORF type:complete len:216 (+),score=76.30 TRINITY_DN1405_c0_g1_i1:53-649(+)